MNKKEGYLQHGVKSSDDDVWSSIERRVPGSEFSGDESFAWENLESSEHGIDGSFSNRRDESGKANKCCCRNKFIHPRVSSFKGVSSSLSSSDDTTILANGIDTRKFCHVDARQLVERINISEEQIEFLTTSLKQVVSVLNSMVLEINRLKQNSEQKPRIWVSKLKTVLNTTTTETTQRQIIHKK